MTYPFKRSQPAQSPVPSSSPAPSSSVAASAVRSNQITSSNMADALPPPPAKPTAAQLKQQRWMALPALCQNLWASAKAPVRLSQAIGMPALCLSLLGWFMVTSASMDLSDRWYHHPYFFAKRHGLYLLLSLAVFAVVIRIPSRLWQTFSAPLLLISLALLVLVLVPGIGHEVNGSIRWIELGLVNFQPSELAKLAILFYVGAYLVRRQQEVQTQWRGFLKPFLVLSMFIVLLLFEPDFGTVVVLLGTVLGMMFMGGVKPLQFLLLITASMGMGAAILVSQPYRLQRLLAYLDPWAPDHILGTSYQLTQSLMAFGRGQLTGVGIGQSIQKQFYLPEAHTDFVFAIWAEETGLIGAVGALILFVVLVVNLVRHAIKAQYLNALFEAYVLYGIAVLLSLQVFINLGVNTGLLPTKGLTLPFLSYGGSSLMTTAIMMAVATRIISERRLHPQRSQPPY